MEIWGKEAILDCRAGKLEKLSGERNVDGTLKYPDAAQNIINFVKELVQAIDMVAYGEPQILHFAEHKPEAAGYTLTQPIETSLISGHFSNLTGDFYLNVFSCKDFDIKTVLEVTQKYFEPELIRENLISRGAR